MSPRPKPEPAPLGKESVWEYPRPPAVEPSGELVEVRLGGELVVSTRGALRVLETSHPPTYYLPEADFAGGVLCPAEGSTVCEWKGRADYFDVVAGGVTAKRAGWHYPDPVKGYAMLRGFVALMPGQLGSCHVEGELVRAQEGGFYGGWITDRVVGPFKGSPGSWGW